MKVLGMPFDEDDVEWQFVVSSLEMLSGAGEEGLCPRGAGRGHRAGRAVGRRGGTGRSVDQRRGGRAGGGARRHVIVEGAVSPVAVARPNTAVADLLRM
jgi:hypothetical protein